MTPDRVMYTNGTLVQRYLLPKLHQMSSTHTELCDNIR